ncbi:TetR/AcrR family transcriptional regulator [Nonomuraea sp. NPDC050394]|uniref:TetR/AcrR family transcriptional regulator n=1 Tax=Nonomuraea sp. NPDC050394 TaxID=3364363 RepID=UPI0037B91489
MTRTRARRGEGALLREDILRAAEDLLAGSGTEEALTLRAVATRAGISTPSVYLHFADKEALLEAVCLRVWDELARLFRENDHGDPFRALGRCGRAYARFALAHPVQYRVLLMKPPLRDRAATPESAAVAPDAAAVPKGTATVPEGAAAMPEGAATVPEGMAAVPEAAAACFGHMVAVVERCVESGVLRGDPRRLALTLWSSMHGCVALLLAQPGFPWPDVDELIDQAVIVAGFGSTMLSRVPETGIPASAELAGDLDELAERLSRRRSGAEGRSGRSRTGGRSLPR